MDDITIKLNTLTEHLENASFLVSKGNCAQQAHSEIIQSLIVVSELKKMQPKKRSALSKHSKENQIIKVQRRLNLWKTRQHQTNAKILNAYLRLTHQGKTFITEQDLKNEFGEPDFETNFIQMKNIADKNHGKIFDHNGEQIEIWEPISQFISSYEKAVFK